MWLNQSQRPIEEDQLDEQVLTEIDTSSDDVDDDVVAAVATLAATVDTKQGLVRTAVSPYGCSHS